MTTRQATIAYWHGREAAYGLEPLPDESQQLPCPHDVGVFIGYDQQSGEQMWKCTMCGETTID